jgi:hypothetical protein
VAAIPVGEAPVGVATVDRGRTVIVADSNRFLGDPDDDEELSVVDTKTASVVGTLPAGAFPREVTLSRDGRTLLVTNFGSSTLELIDVRRLKEAMKAVPPPFDPEAPLTEQIKSALNGLWAGSSDLSAFDAKCWANDMAPNLARTKQTLQRFGPIQSLELMRAKETLPAGIRYRFKAAFGTHYLPVTVYIGPDGNIVSFRVGIN